MAILLKDQWFNLMAAKLPFINFPYGFELLYRKRMVLRMTFSPFFCSHEWMTTCTLKDGTEKKYSNDHEFNIEYLTR